MLVQHSAASVEHYTPAWVVEKARRVLGSIDLDPASCEEANKVVKATTYYSEGGLFKPWRGCVFLNPPGGKLHPDTFEPIKAGPGLSAAAVYWAKLYGDYRVWCDVSAAIFVAFSLNIFQNAQQFGSPPQAFPFVVPEKRIAFEGPGPRSSPSHPNAIVYLGTDVEAFRREFQDVGWIVEPRVIL